MEPVTLALIALTLVATKATEKVGEQLGEGAVAAAKQLWEVLGRRSPETAQRLQAASESSDDNIIAVEILEEVKQVAAVDPEVQAAVEATSAAIITEPNSRQTLMTVADREGVIQMGKGDNIAGDSVARDKIGTQIINNIQLHQKTEWEGIAEREETKKPDQLISVDELVQTVRDNIYDSIYEKCGFMKVFDMSQRIGLDDIYIAVNISEEITGRRRLEMAELSKPANLENFEQFGLRGVQEKRVPGLEAVNKHPKLMILGKPGTGKTTFLKHLAVQCIEGKFKPNLVPLFVTLKDFAEDPDKPSLLNYLIELSANHGVEPTKVDTESSTTPFKSHVELLLNQGRVMLLLDGLDEVKEVDHSRVLRQLKDFASSKFHKNLITVTCRIAAEKYRFEQFTDVEIADFDDQQIAAFASRWFQAKQDLPKAEIFMDKLKQSRGIWELATSPLLLTLLCTVFEKSGTFPANRSKLYKEGLDELLKEWDAKNDIRRDQAYKRLSLPRKKDLLSQIAMDTFERENYRFEQEEIERKITVYIRNLPDANIKEEALQLDSEAVLKSIEAQHGLLVEQARGIYSFSHLTFHEYFTARKLVTSSKSDIFRTQLLPHLTEKRWQEVFLLTVGMVESADELLQAIKQRIDRLVSEDDNIQQLLTWLQKKSSSVNVSYKPAAVRAFYLDRNIAYKRTDDNDLALACALDNALNNDIYRDYVHHDYLENYYEDPANYLDYIHKDILARDRNSDFARVSDLARNLDKTAIRDFTLAFARNIVLDNDIDINIDRAFKVARNIDLALRSDRKCDPDSALDSAFKQSLQGLRDQLLVSPQKNRKQSKQWWETNGATWTEQLRAVMVEHRNIGHNWQFSSEQQVLMKQYYDSNLLLVACLNSDCNVSREVRQEIESSLLLPTRPCSPPGS
jgi:predicted NACHT family NTPase